MGRKKCITLLAGICLWTAAAFAAPQSEPAGATVSSPGTSASAVPRWVRFGGTVRDGAGKPLDGVAEITFALYREDSGGEPLWYETQTVEVDAQGRYNVLLGAMHADALPMDLFTSGEARWLGIMVGKIEQPRVLLVSVPYALKAGDAESLGGKPATAYVAADQLKDQVQTELQTQLADPKIGLRSLETMVTGNSPTPAVSEVSPSTFTCNSALNCITTTQSGTGYAIVANHTRTSGVEYGVYGQTASTSGRAVYGYATATTGTTFGVRALTNSTGGYGMYGVAAATTGFTFGVRGDVASTSGRGVYGFATSTTGSTYGVLGTAASTLGAGIAGSATAVTGVSVGALGTAASTSGVGVLAQATAVSGTTMGLRATNNSPSGTAGVFDALGGGKIISGRTTGFVEKFSVDSAGKLEAVEGEFITASGTAVAAYGGAGKGVFGEGFPGIWGHSTSGTALYGEGGAYGVQVYATGTGVFGEGASGYGVWGNNNSGGYGVVGTTGGAGTAVYGGGGGTGVYGTGTTYGVYGNSGSTGVYGIGGTFGYGVLGATTSGYGVYGQGDNGVRGVGTAAASSTGVAGIGGAEGTGVYGEGAYGVYSAGDFGASGSKAAVVALPDNRVVSLYAMESPVNWFEDFGSAELSNGVAQVTLDPTFALTVNTEIDYHVFLTPKGDSEGLYVAQQSPRGFQVRESRGGRSNVSFDYRIVARRRGFENLRLQEVDTDEEAVAAIRQHNHARPGRPTLRIPRKLELPRTLPQPPQVEARIGSPR